MEDDEDERDDQDTTTLVDLMGERKIAWPKGGTKYFIPNGALNELLTLENIRDELVRIHGQRSPDLDSIAQKTYSSRQKLFAILVWAAFPQEKSRYSIRRFIRDNVTDENLPFHRVYQQDRSFWLCSNGSNCGSKTTGEHCTYGAMRQWKSVDFVKFDQHQWSLLSPVFESKNGEVPHFDFDQNILLPFREDQSENLIEMYRGGFSRVWQVRIVAEHQNIYLPASKEGQEPALAVKQLLFGDEEAFRKEKDVLHLLGKVKHRHFVELLATYCHSGKFHLLFPFADDNLQIYWAGTPRTFWNSATYLWVIDQITGLASALVAIHAYGTNPAYESGEFSRIQTAGQLGVPVEEGEKRFGRHGDIKPENILRTSEGKNAKNPGVLLITDLGLAEFHRKASRSIVKPDLGGSQTYIPPERALLMPISRAYDVWSLGCVYLEFLTWLIEGNDGLKRFHESRVNPTLVNGVDDDSYFTLRLSDQGKYATIRPAVSKQIWTLRQYSRCSNMVSKVLDVVEYRMLEVNPTKRSNANEIHKRLRDIHKDSKRSNAFLVGAHPTDEGKGCAGLPTHSS